jgi:gluconate 2-dehydrogenase subunit 3-like protein
MAPRNFRLAEHLPNLRKGGDPADPYELPRQRNGVTPQMHGRYPDFNVLDEVDHWDQATRQVVLERVNNTPPIRFFTEREAHTLGQFADVVLAQDREPRIPVINMVDAKLYSGKREGYRYAEMPDDGVTFRRLADGLDVAARQHGSRDFVSASHDVQTTIVQAFSSGELHGQVWDELPCEKAWQVVMRELLSAFYSHPWAWNEIGFGGPAYPRGYARLGIGQRESWEGAPAFERDPVADTRERSVEGT